MFDIKNVKPRTLVIIGVVSLVLIVSIIAVYFIFIKKDTPVKKDTSAKTVTPVRTGTPVGTSTPVRTGTPVSTSTPVRKPEVYLQELKNGINIVPGQFKMIKSDYPNITLATTQQIEQALKDGLKMCGHGMAVDISNKELCVYVKPGPGSIQRSGNTGGEYCASQGLDFNVPMYAAQIWVYGVKPLNGTVGVYRFSAEKWSQYDALPTGR